MQPKNQPIFINRASETLFTDIVKIHKRGLDIRLTPDVQFACEEAMDASGPSREYFHLMMKSIAAGDRRVCLFEGEAGHLLPIHSTDALESNLFYYIGRMIAPSFLHGGFPFVGMSKAVIAYIITSSVDEALPYLTIEDVPDFTVRKLMQEVIFRNWHKRWRQMGLFSRGPKLIPFGTFLHQNLGIFKQC